MLRLRDNEVTTAQIEAEKAQVTACDRIRPNLKYDTVTADTAGTITSYERRFAQSVQG